MGVNSTCVTDADQALLLEKATNHDASDPTAVQLES